MAKGETPPTELTQHDVEILNVILRARRPSSCVYIVHSANRILMQPGLVCNHECIKRHQKALGELTTEWYQSNAVVALVRHNSRGVKWRAKEDLCNCVV